MVTTRQEKFSIEKELRDILADSAEIDLNTFGKTLRVLCVAIIGEHQINTESELEQITQDRHLLANIDKTFTRNKKRILEAIKKLFDGKLPNDPTAYDLPNWLGQFGVEGLFKDREIRAAQDLSRISIVQAEKQRMREQTVRNKHFVNQRCSFQLLVSDAINRNYVKDKPIDLDYPKLRSISVRTISGQQEVRLVLKEGGAYTLFFSKRKDNARTIYELSRIIEYKNDGKKSELNLAPLSGLTDITTQQITDFINEMSEKTGINFLNEDVIIATAPSSTTAS